MNILFTKIRDKHALWYKGIVFAFCVVVCTYLLPKNNSLQTSQLNVGDVWLNSDLIAPFDFLVKKTNDEMALEKKELKSQIAYFKKTTPNIDNLLSKLQGIKGEKIIELKLLLDSIYKVGVYFQNQPSNYEDSVMYVVDNNEVVLVQRQKLFKNTRHSFSTHTKRIIQ